MANNEKYSGGFVAGTLVHSKDGLKPIEQIEVGDWVLSKPESGEGETCCKRVARTYEHDDGEVYLLMYSILNEQNQIEREHVVVTGEHPVWVSQLESRDPDNQEVKDCSAWLTVSQIVRLKEDAVVRPIFELQDGRLARYQNSGPIVLTDIPELGLVFSDPIGYFKWLSIGVGVDFSSGLPVIPLDERGDEKLIDLGLEYENNVRIPDSDSIYLKTSCHPLLRKVYAFQLEDEGSYFVGALGIRVCNPI